MALCTKRRFYSLFILIVAGFLVEFWIFVPFAPKQKIPVLEDFISSGLQPDCALRTLYNVDDSVLDTLDMHSCLTDYLKYDTMCLLYFKQQEQGPTTPVSEYKMLDSSHYEPAFDKCILPNDTTSSGVTKKDVPKIVYYVFYGLNTLTFMEYMSFLSVKKFVEPWSIYVISDRKPTGQWWNQIEAEIGVRFVHRTRPKWIGDQRIAFNSHSENMVVLQSLLVNGGISLDLDVILLHSLDPLLQYPVTMGLLGEERRLGSDLILGLRNDMFLRLWHDRYSFYNARDPDFNLQHVPYKLYKSYPKHIHVETTRFFYPNQTEIDELFLRKTDDWRNYYAIHLWQSPAFPYPESLEDIKLMDNTLGQALRYINSGDQHLVNADKL